MTLDLRLLAFFVSAVAGACVSPALPPVLRLLALERKNYAGAPIGSGGGVLFMLAAVPWLWLRGGEAAATVFIFGALGFVDDRWGTAEFRGLRGHLLALRSGRLTTGMLKAAGGLIAAGVLAWRLHPGLEAVVGALLIALSANFLNLLDLRPLRALKLFWLAGAALAAWSPAVLAGCAGASLPYAWQEARRRVMLGDTGANGLGALLGYCAARALPAWGTALLAGLLMALHLWAERNSIGAWIERHPFWRGIDRWGWAAHRDTDGNVN
jgi:UDP-GlcNAc:undecaprenyl-phosphate GlcNAc-1-phosphate transferase